MDYRTVLTTCAYCGCGCGLYLEVLDGRIINTIPSKTNPNFLMTRATHMVGRSLCIYCGLCEEVCPADIPLKSLYKLVTKIVGQEATTPESLAAQQEAVGSRQQAIG